QPERSASLGPCPIGRRPSVARARKTRRTILSSGDKRGPLFARSIDLSTIHALPPADIPGGRECCRSWRADPAMPDLPLFEPLLRSLEVWPDGPRFRPTLIGAIRRRLPYSSRCYSRLRATRCC